ncbi:hypothetical protein [Chitinivorax sp. B]|uniref:hypothetical protein n=1 Tax=Chitinivorax sp. B TaxID=2502235 RepID=UPI0010F84324|nr:hypothetical protein [Chitinivorax sp. B]
MNGHNALFMADPLWYIKQRAINGVAWFMRGQANRANQMQNTMLNTLKEGVFDLQGEGQAHQVTLTPVGQVLHGDQPIQAYWCPFVQGMVLPGFVDVPKVNPRCKFVFTAAMNGCALVVTESPLGANMIRVYHNQHPGNQQINQLIRNQGREVISFISFDDYGDANQQMPAPNAFNFLYYRNGGWRFVIQPQLFNMATHVVTLNPNIPTQISDATF